MNIGTKIKEARQTLGITQEQVAEQLLVSRQTVSSWENCKSLPDIVSVIKMSELYHLSLDELLKGDKDMMKKIEKDTKLAKIQKNFIYAAWCIIAIYAVIALLSIFFKGTPVIDFLSGAAPGILLGVSFLLGILSLNKPENKE